MSWQRFAHACRQVVTRLDVVQVGVGKVNALFDQVECEAVGPVEFCRNENGSIGAVQVGALNARSFAPVGPEDEARFGARVYGESARIRHVFLLDQKKLF